MNNNYKWLDKNQFANHFLYPINKAAPTTKAIGAKPHNPLWGY